MEEETRIKNDARPMDWKAYLSIAQGNTLRMNATRQHALKGQKKINSEMQNKKA